MFIELHIIQNFPPSNLNRDDLGQPKDTDFGGYRRARISSQSLKRVIRGQDPDPEKRKRSVFAKYTEVPLAARSKMLANSLAKRMAAESQNDANAEAIAIEFARVYSSKKGNMETNKPEQTSVLLYMADEELDEVAGYLLTLNWAEVASEIASLDEQTFKKPETRVNKSPLIKFVNDWISKTKGRTSAPDIALFGRMLADRPETNIDAACQVAHAISTHSIGGRTPIDYYTAVDELKPKSDPGAAFLDVAYFNSPCFYRYARIDFEQLKTNLGGDHEMAVKSVEAFLRASEAAIPTGKKNAYAPECRPSFMLAVLREKESAGWSLVNAFQKPVDAQSEGDLIVASVKRLEKRFSHLREFYREDGTDTVRAFAVALPDGSVEVDDLDKGFRKHTKNMSGWVDAICQPLRTGA